MQGGESTKHRTKYPAYMHIPSGQALSPSRGSSSPSASMHYLFLHHSSFLRSKPLKLVNWFFFSFLPFLQLAPLLCVVDRCPHGPCEYEGNQDSPSISCNRGQGKCPNKIAKGKLKTPSLPPISLNHMVMNTNLWEFEAENREGKWIPLFDVRPHILL